MEGGAYVADETKDDLISAKTKSPDLPASL